MKELRFKRVFKGSPPRAVIVPMDHGVTQGPIKGLDNVHQMVAKVQEGSDAIVVHKGVAKRLGGLSCGVIVHLSASHEFSPSANTKVLIGSVEEAVRLGADGVSVHINLGDELDREMIRDLGLISREADYWGMPLLAMIYPRGKGVRNPFDPGLVAHGARLGAELGADIVKVPYTGDPDSFSRVVEGCFVPVVIAGGPKSSNPEDLLRMVKEAMESGAAGVSIGRNVFQHEDPGKMLDALRAIVHGGVSLEEAINVLRR